jgi:hypothetical protein
VNLAYIKVRTMLSAMNMLPAPVRDKAIRDALHSALGSADVGFGPALGVIGDALPADPGVRRAWSVFRDELWRWWRDGGGHE